MSKVYFFHEYGAPSHVYGLEYLLNKYDIKLEHREFNYSGQFFFLARQIKHLRFNFTKRFCQNIGFLLSLLFTKDRKIVLGIAPYNYYLKWLRYFFKRHKVYYFTSYTCWDQTRMANSQHYSPKVLNIWKKFIHDEVKHIFTVSDLTHKELVKNGFNKSENISIVYHSYIENIEASTAVEKNNYFLYVGRLVESKGIEELLNIFSTLPHCSLTIVGRGYLDSKVQEATKLYTNIHYKGYIEGLENIIPIYKENSFLLLNSQRTETWEELFGISLVEGMACGLIPIATNHPGPTEIITSEKDGILCKEGSIKEAIEYVLKMSDDEFFLMKQNAIIRGQEFRSSEISHRWEAILE